MPLKKLEIVKSSGFRFGIFGQTLAAAGGEMRPNYFKNSPPKMFYFYILKCKDGTLYSGSAKDLKQREQKHNSGQGSKYVTAHGGGKIVYYEKFRGWGKTLRREAEVKKWSRKKKLALIKKSKMSGIQN